MNSDSNRDEERQHRREKMWRNKDQDKNKGNFERSPKSTPYRRRQQNNLENFDEEDERFDDYLEY
jgi:hypothetical protein